MDPAHFEAAINGDVSKFPFCNIEREDLLDIFSKVSPSGNSLLHVASSSGQEEMTQLIARKFSFLITRKNSEGNTPLHLAVRAQNLNTIRILVQLAEQIPNTSTGTLLTMKNDEGNTALHEALFAIRTAKENVNTSVDIACFLVLHDPDVSCHQNNAGKSPLCLAVESGNKEVLEYILNALPEGDDLLQRLEGKSPVHVAIGHKKIDMLITAVKEQKEELLCLRDEEGNTPLHFAASIGYIKGVRHLLEIKSNLAFKRNNKGFYPLHSACENGNIEIVKELFRKWPDPTELLCDEGQSILHVAAKSGNDNVVRWILSEKGIDKLVNKMDTNGNTPSHLAALHGHSMVVVTLLFDKRSKTDLVNYQGLTSYDIFKSNMLKLQDDQTEVNDKNLKASGENSVEADLKRRFKPFQMMITYWMLYMYYEIFRSHSSMKISHAKSKPPTPKQNLTNTINNLFVVAALLVGAAFAGILQLPVDNDKAKDKDHDRDSAMLSVFLFFNVLTMSLSIAASFTLFLALVLDNYLATILVAVAFLMLELALTFIGIAFLWAIQIRVKNLDLEYYPILHELDTMIICFRFILMVLVIVPFVICTLGQKGLSLITYLVLFCFYFLLYRLWIMIRYNSLKTLIKFVIFCSVFVIPVWIYLFPICGEYNIYVG